MPVGLLRGSGDGHGRHGMNVGGSRGRGGRAASPVREEEEKGGRPSRESTPVGTYAVWVSSSPLELSPLANLDTHLEEHLECPSIDFLFLAIALEALSLSSSPTHTALPRRRRRRRGPTPTAPAPARALPWQRAALSARRARSQLKRSCGEHAHGRRFGCPGCSAARGGRSRTRSPRPPTLLRSRPARTRRWAASSSAPRTRR